MALGGALNYHWSACNQEITRRSRWILGKDGLTVSDGIQVFKDLAKGEVAKARRAFATIVKIDPGNSKALFNLGILYHNKLNDPASAMKYYQRFVAAERGRLSKNHEVYTYIRQLKSIPKRRKVRKKTTKKKRTLKKKGLKK